MSQHKGDLIQVAAFLAISGGSLILHAFKKMKLSRKIEDTPTSLISSAPQGTVEIQGYAWPVEILQSPITQRPCVYYKLVIEEERKSKNNSRWVKVFEAQTHQPFGVVDKSGYAMVFPVGAEVDAISMTFTSLTEVQIQSAMDFLAKNNCDISLRGGFFSSRKRIKESVIAMGCPVYTFGGFKTISGFRPFNLVSGCDLFFTRINQFNPRVAMAQGKNITSREDNYRFEAIAHECSKESSLSVAVGESFRSNQGVTKYSVSAGVFTHTVESPLFVADAHQNALLKRIGSFNLVKIILGAALLAGCAALLFSKYNPV